MLPARVQKRLENRTENEVSFTFRSTMKSMLNCLRIHIMNGDDLIFIEIKTNSQSKKRKKCNVRRSTERYTSRHKLNQVR